MPGQPDLLPADLAGVRGRIGPAKRDPRCGAELGGAFGLPGREVADLVSLPSFGVGATVVPVPPGTLERTEFKARRVIDDRDLWREARRS